MTSIRKIYQKAIITPTHHIEQIWKDYESFENSVSHQLVAVFTFYYIKPFQITIFVFSKLICKNMVFLLMNS